MRQSLLAFSVLVSRAVSSNIISSTADEVLASSQDESIPTNRFLVEFKENNSLARDAKDEATGFLKILEASGVPAQITYQYSTIIFHGVSVHLPTSTDWGFIQELEDVASVRQVTVTKAPDTVLPPNFGSTTGQNANFARAMTEPLGPPLVIQKSQYQYTASASSVTFTHAKKNALAVGLIQQNTPVFAVFFSVYFHNQFKDVYVPVYETQGNSGDFKLDRLPSAPTGQVNIVLTTANGNTTFISDGNTISGVGLIEVLPVGHRDPYPTSLKPWTIHHMTGVDKLHSSGIRGKGIKIGIIDGGIDYNHPALGGGFGPGFKVVGGYDFVGDGLRPDNEPWVGDDDPMDYCSTSTAWAGILSADDQYTGMLGVAPDASIYAYKISSCSQIAGEDVVLAALQRAYEDDVDIISVAHGGSTTPGGPNNIISLATARLVAEGLFIVTPSLNNGDVGGFTPSSSTMGKGVAAVGSVDVDQTHATVAYATIDGKKGQRQIPYLESFGLGVVDGLGWPLVGKSPVIAVTGSCTLSIPDSTPSDLSNYTVVVPRDCLFDEIETELAQYKPLVVLVYNTDPSESLVMPARTLFKMINLESIGYDDGKYLVDTLNVGSKITLEYNWFPGVGVENKNNGGGLSDFTAWGPDYQGGLWPQLVAPGNGIFSTYHLIHNSYLDVAGTSASQAYITGVAALYYSQHGGKKGVGKEGTEKLLNQMIATADPIEWQDGTGMDVYTPFKKRDGTGLAPVAQQGGGLINAKALLASTTTVSPSYIQLGDKSTFKSTWAIKISNPSSAAMTYGIAHNPSVTFLSLDRDEPYKMRPNPGAITNSNYATLSFPTSITVPAGSTSTLNLKITAPADDEDYPSAFLPVYSGYLTFSNANEKINIPYQGIATNLRSEVPIWSDAVAPFPLATDPFFERILFPDSEEVFSFAMNPNDCIVLVGYNTYGTDEQRVDIVSPEWTEKDWNYPPKKNFIGTIRLTNPLDDVSFPITYVSRTQDRPWQFGWLGLLANGSTIANGQYKIVQSVLLPTGDRTKKDDWQISETSVFEVAIPY